MANQHHTPERDLVDHGGRGGFALANDQCHAWDTVGQHAQAAASAAHAVVLERSSGLEHQRDHGTDLQLECSNRGGDRQERQVVECVAVLANGGDAVDDEWRGAEEDDDQSQRIAESIAVDVKREGDQQPDQHEQGARIHAHDTPRPDRSRS